MSDAEATDVDADTDADADADADADVDFDVERLAELSEAIGDGVTELKRAIVEGAPESDLLETASDLWDVLEEFEELLETIDLTRIPEAIDFEDLPETIDVEDVPEGLFDEDKSAIELRNVREAVNLRELWDAVELTELVQEKRELDSAMDDVTDDDDDEDDGDDGLLDDGFGGDDGLIDDDDDNGWLGDDDDELFQNVVDTGEGANVQFGKEARQEFLEENILDAVEKFRSAMLSTHERLRKLYEANQEKLGDPGRQPDSLNPTAASTMPPGPIPDSVSARTSTVPSQVKYSRATNPRRIYGRRFEEATGAEDSADSSDSADDVDSAADAESADGGDDTDDEAEERTGAGDDETVELGVYDG